MQSNAMSAEFGSRQLSPALRRRTGDGIKGQPFLLLSTVRHHDVISKYF
jgi:hypothetical protein